jgi:hypothetical protein
MMRQCHVVKSFVLMAERVAPPVTVPKSVIVLLPTNRLCIRHLLEKLASTNRPLFALRREIKKSDSVSTGEYAILPPTAIPTVLVQSAGWVSIVKSPTSSIDQTRIQLVETLFVTMVELVCKQL